MRLFYTLLGVESDAADAEIVRAERRVRAIVHPDKHGGRDEAAACFKAIGQLGAILRDPSKRRQYDEFGEHAFDENFAPKQRGSAGARDARHITLTPEEAAVGTTCELHVTRRRPCEQCGTHGHVHWLCGHCNGAARVVAWNPQPCAICSGTGRWALGGHLWDCAVCRTTGEVQAPSFAPCPSCSAAGVTRSRCPSCNGLGHELVVVPVRVSIPAGVMSGTVLRFVEAADGLGDVFLEVLVVGTRTA